MLVKMEETGQRHQVAVLIEAFQGGIVGALPFPVSLFSIDGATAQHASRDVVCLA